ncbi:MAG: hypothetical protein EYC62_05670 [Alphaproteobacteria bacterium]|nr:MAG: hypothetical protein EYC62_05670 [Alphaproteobacteria bacterium]
MSKRNKVASSFSAGMVSWSGVCKAVRFGAPVSGKKFSNTILPSLSKFKIKFGPSTLLCASPKSKSRPTTVPGSTVMVLTSPSCGSATKTLLVNKSALGGFSAFGGVAEGIVAFFAITCCSIRPNNITKSL